MRRVLCLGLLRRTGAGWSAHLMRVVKLAPFRAPERNGALLYMACGNVLVRSARPPPGSLTCHRSGQPVSLRSVQEARPFAAIPITLLRHSLPAGHAKHGAAPTGAFDWTQSGQSGLGGTPTSAWEYRKRYSHALLAYVRVYSLNPPFVYVIIHTTLRRRIGICGGDTELLRRCFHEIS